MRESKIQIPTTPVMRNASLLVAIQGLIRALAEITETVINYKFFLLIKY